ncbi:hypothetical protein DFJ77DRAFT_550943 [Powellomyces hirtus]|nr:hypothetical protein DFJ77DRAFT_550943 [Powellomyces hirtus]
MDFLDAREKSFAKGRPVWPYKRLKDQKIYTIKVFRSGWYLQKGPMSCVCAVCDATRQEFSLTDDPFTGHTRTCALGAFWSAFSSNSDIHSQRNVELRQRTFSACSWPYEGKEGWEGLSGEKMAAAGFIHQPLSDAPDTVLCPYCDVSLDGWEETDNAIEEHKKRAAKCQFFDPPTTSASGSATTAGAGTTKAAAARKTVVSSSRASTAVPTRRTTKAKQTALGSEALAEEEIESDPVVPAVAASSSRAKRKVVAVEVAVAPQAGKRPKTGTRKTTTAANASAENIEPPAEESSATNSMDLVASVPEAAITQSSDAVEPASISSAPDSQTTTTTESSNTAPTVTAGVRRPRREKAKGVCYAEDVVDLDGKPRQTKRARTQKATSPTAADAAVTTATTRDEAAAETIPSPTNPTDLETHAPVTTDHETAVVEQEQERPETVASSPPAPVKKTRGRAIGQKSTGSRSIATGSQSTFSTLVPAAVDVPATIDDEPGNQQKVALPLTKKATSKTRGKAATATQGKKPLIPNAPVVTHESEQETASGPATPVSSPLTEQLSSAGASESSQEELPSLRKVLAKAAKGKAAGRKYRTSLESVDGGADTVAPPANDVVPPLTTETESELSEQQAEKVVPPLSPPPRMKKPAGATRRRGRPSAAAADAAAEDTTVTSLAADAPAPSEGSGSTSRASSTEPHTAPTTKRGPATRSTATRATGSRRKAAIAAPVTASTTTNSDNTPADATPPTRDRPDADASGDTMPEQEESSPPPAAAVAKKATTAAAAPTRGRQPVQKKAMPRVTVPPHNEDGDDGDENGNEGAAALRTRDDLSKQTKTTAAARNDGPAITDMTAPQVEDNTENAVWEEEEVEAHVNSLELLPALTMISSTTSDFVNHDNNSNSSKKKSGDDEEKHEDTRIGVAVVAVAPAAEPSHAAITAGKSIRHHHQHHHSFPPPPETPAAVASCTTNPALPSTQHSKHTIINPVRITPLEHTNTHTNDTMTPTTMATMSIQQFAAYQADVTRAAFRAKRQRAWEKVEQEFGRLEVWIRERGEAQVGK